MPLPPPRSSSAWQGLHTRTSRRMSTCLIRKRLPLQASHTICPQFRQWWRRFSRVKDALQPWHSEECASGFHSGATELVCKLMRSCCFSMASRMAACHSLRSASVLFTTTMLNQLSLDNTSTADSLGADDERL